MITVFNYENTRTWTADNAEACPLQTWIIYVSFITFCDKSCRHILQNRDSKTSTWYETDKFAIKCPYKVLCNEAHGTSVWQRWALGNQTVRGVRESRTSREKTMQLGQVWLPLWTSSIVQGAKPPRYHVKYPWPIRYLAFESDSDMT